MVRLWLIVGFVALLFWVVTIVDCAVQPPTRHRGVGKPAWLVIVVVFPVIGGILWLTIGRTRRSQMRAPRAPDDDPEFLGRITLSSDQDERIRRLEEELAQLDAEDDDPKWNLPYQSRSKDAGTGASEPTSKEPPRAPEHPVDGDDDGRGQRGAVG